MIEINKCHGKVKINTLTRASLQNIKFKDVKEALVFEIFSALEWLKVQLLFEFLKSQFRLNQPTERERERKRERESPDLVLVQRLPMAPLQPCRESRRTSM